MAREQHVTPDGALTLVVARDDDGDITVGFDGFPWHTHGDLLAANYPLADLSGSRPNPQPRDSYKTSRGIGQ
jgi:hypothetical protein